MQDERSYLRSLAQRVAEAAAGPKNAAVCKRWRDVNALRKPDRPPVWCRPVGAWKELLPEDALRCTEPWLRNVERHLRREIIKLDIGDDTPFDGTFPVQAVFRFDPPNVWGVDMRHIKPDEEDGAWAYDPPLQTEEDFDKLRLPRLTYDERRTEINLSRVHDLLGDILPVKLVCGAPLTATLCNPAAHLRGLTQMMMDMIDAPHLVHRLMAHMRDGVLGAMRQVQATGLLTPNTNDPMTCSDPIDPPPPGEPITYKNMWVMANSQEFDQVSPRMWEEFCLNYQLPVFEEFGLVGYGCCENLTHKIDGVLSIPNLRIFVCSAWTDLPTVIERVGDKHVIMWRQKASAVVYAPDEAALKRDLEEGLRQLRGCYTQVVLRELQTLAGNMDRLHVWTRLAIDIAEKFA
ncbi:MAG: hypothetical protein ACOYEP_05975 [Limnochordia bacterium]|jgi:hypothetical protein